MDPTLLAGVLGATGTLVAPIIAWHFANRSEQKQKRYTQISTDRTERLSNSNWKGQYHLVGEAPTEISVVFTVKKSIVTGKATYTHNSRGRTEIVLEGGFISDNLLKLDYRNMYSHKLHFGCMILEIDGDAHRLDGGLIAYGRDPDKVYNGEIILRVT